MFNQYPYLNLNDLNLDYVLNAIRELRYDVTNFVSINAIKYADPIQWNITSQYEKNTIVIDPVTGTAYISVAPVPSGVALTRPEYWTVVFDLGSFVTRAAQNFTSRWESVTTTTATFPTNTGEWLVWGDVLYKAISNIIAGDTYVVGSNIEHFTIEDLYNAYLNTIAQILGMIGDVGTLETTDTSNIVNAINSLVGSVVFRAPTVAAMIASDYPLNATVITQGYHSVNDGGSAEYTIVDTAPADAYYESLTNGTFAVLTIKSTMTFEQFGAYGDNVNDDAPAIQNAIKYCGNIRANNIYRIKSAIEMNSTGDLTPELATDPDCHIMGKGKNVSLTVSASTVADISEDEATFVMDGGYFHLRGTSRVDFSNCVFMGETSDTKAESAFELTDPARKLNISDCTFANLKYGIHCDENGRWSGESIYSGLYFILCEYGIKYDGQGKDNIIDKCIAQGNTDYMVWLENGIACLFSNNHDYSKYGTYIFFGGNIVNNYFDGVEKLHIKTSYDRSGSLTNKYSSHGTNITGNTFVMSFHDTVLTGAKAFIVVENDRFVSTNITNNIVHGGADYADIALIDMTNVDYSANNVIKNNTGLGLNALFKNVKNSAINYYYNDYEGYHPYAEVDATYTDVRQGTIVCNGGFIIFVRINNPSTTISNAIEVKNLPPLGTCNSITFRIDSSNNLSQITNSSYLESVAAGNKQTTIFFINTGSVDMSEMLMNVVG